MVPDGSINAFLNKGVLSILVPRMAVSKWYTKREKGGKSVVLVGGI